MEPRVGATLRQARKRREIELSEVEAATRVRLKYLRAIEDEDWEALPGSVYTRGFIRAYASFLGLDGERLAAEHRQGAEGEPGVEPVLPVRSPRSGDRQRRAVRGLGWIVAAGVLLVAVLVIVTLPEGGDEGVGPPEPAGSRPATNAGSREQPQPKPRAGLVSVSLVTSAEVWVCLVGDGGRHLVDGQILEAGAAAGPFRSGSFTVSFGNGEVSMLIDGKEAEIPATSSPIGYSIDAEGELTRLSEAERPTCA